MSKSVDVIAGGTLQALLVHATGCRPLPLRRAASAAAMRPLLLHSRVLWHSSVLCGITA